MSEGSPNVFTVADEPSLPAGPAPKKRKGSGRRKDPVWELTTVFSDKRVVCNRCNALIHRHGITKVERVRNHFERRCPKVHDHLATSSKAEESAGAMDLVELPASGPMETKSRQNKASGNYGNKSGAFKRKFAYWLYATGKPFEDAENELLLSALKVLRGDVALPTKHELENELLELEYAASKNKVSKAIGGKKCCLTVENSVDTGGCGVTTYGAICDGVQYFLESKAPVTQDVNGELMADDVELVMSKEKKAEFYGVVAPTTAALSKFSRERIQKKHPRCSFFHGCVSHALTLLLDDVASILPWLQRVQASVVELASVFHGNHKLQVLLPAGENTPAVEFPVSSCVSASLEYVLKHEKELYSVVARRDFTDANTPAEQEKLKRVQDFVLGETFVQDLINSLAILRPLQQNLEHFQEDRPPLSQVFPHFVELLTVYASMEWVTKKEKALITSCVTERFNAIYGESHGVAYMLDPLYLGEALDARKQKEVETFIVRFCEHEGHTVDILAQLEKYKTLVTELRNSNEAYWQLLESGAVTPNDFWVERRQFPHLQQLAHAVFALPASSISPSPSFGVQGVEIHSRFNRALSPDKLEKLSHIYCNSKRDGGGGDPLSTGPQLLY